MNLGGENNAFTNSEKQQLLVLQWLHNNPWNYIKHIILWRTTQTLVNSVPQLEVILVRWWGVTKRENFDTRVYHVDLRWGRIFCNMQPRKTRRDSESHGEYPQVGWCTRVNTTHRLSVWVITACLASCQWTESDICHYVTRIARKMISNGMINAFEYLALLLIMSNRNMLRILIVVRRARMLPDAPRDKCVLRYSCFPIFLGNCASLQ